jgi:UDP-N-acetylmuramate: L-alanyl-gamma-D-glutamyl-meso-diaminopimelate ligase
MSAIIQKVHIIAMGGSVMHALAIALKKQGVTVTGSDDNFFDPSKSRLAEHGLLPATNGWNPANITADLDVVILGMHAHADNPELLKAREKGLSIVSFPEFIYQKSKNKQRLVIGGSHGKTTITSMIMHVLQYLGIEFDYVVGAKVKGFEETVKLSDAPVIVIEGDEYLSSRIDPTPKFHHYQHDIGLISGIAWDHVNVFPTEEDYIKQFEIFAEATPNSGALIYNEEDELVRAIGEADSSHMVTMAYNTHPNEVIDGHTYLLVEDRKIKVGVFGEHNMLNLAGAKLVLAQLGVSDEAFYEAMKSFELPSLRLNILKEAEDYTVYRDYAHAPSKVQATVKAVKSLNPDRKLTGLFELHTYSSLNKKFLNRYANTLNPCDQAIVFYNPKAVAQKKLEKINPEDITKAFSHPNLTVLSDVEELSKTLSQVDNKDRNLLLMSSSNFGELDLLSIF